MAKKKPVGEAIPAAPLPKAPGEKDEHDYEAESMMRTLMDAEKIKAHPEKMKRVHAMAGRHIKALKAIKSVQDLKNVYNDKFGASVPDKDSDGE